MGLEQRNNIIQYRVWHCLKRLKTRFGVYIDELEYFDMVLSIIKQESQHLFKVSNTTSVHRVKFRNENLTVVYNKKHHIVVTVLKNKWIGQNKDGKYFLKPRKKKKIKKSKSQRVHWKVKLKHRDKEKRRKTECENQ